MNPGLDSTTTDIQPHVRACVRTHVRVYLVLEVVVKYVIIIKSTMSHVGITYQDQIRVYPRPSCVGLHPRGCIRALMGMGWGGV